MQFTDSKAAYEEERNCY